MKRSELEKHIGESVEVKLFDGDTMQGVLRKTGTEEVRNNPKEEWGAEPGTEYCTLHIHEIRERKDC